MEDLRREIEKLKDRLYILERDINRKLNHLTSQNVKELDFNITVVKNGNKIKG